jgi:lipoprotein-anchoring transpeptidase ErfK/SrfK
MMQISLARNQNTLADHTLADHPLDSDLSRKSDDVCFWFGHGPLRRSTRRNIVIIVCIVLLLTLVPSAVKAESEKAQSSPATTEFRWIEVDLSDQRLTAWQNYTLVLETAVSTGRAEYPTVKGMFHIRNKLASRRMQGQDYDMPDVPWTMYFFRDFAIHGAYWHNDFGVPVSHGCVNLPVSDAKRLFDWAEIGTIVIIHE